MVVLGQSERRLLTAAEFQGLSDVPPEAEWFANLANPRTRRAYQGDIREFMAFVGIKGAGEFRLVTRAHALAWRKELERRGHAAATIRRKLEDYKAMLRDGWAGSMDGLIEQIEGDTVFVRLVDGQAWRFGLKQFLEVTVEYETGKVRSCGIDRPFAPQA